MEHKINLLERNTLEVTGVKDLISFDRESFFIVTTKGLLSIQGESLGLKNLDTEKGLLVVIGDISKISYEN